jgi:hypothetical protein
MCRLVCNLSVKSWALSVKRSNFASAYAEATADKTVDKTADRSNF